MKRGNQFLLWAFAFVAVSFLSFCAPTSSSVKESSGIPLIPYTIHPAPPGTSESVKALLGKWEGTFGTQRVGEQYETVLIVEKVNPEVKKAQIVFAWNPPFEWYTKGPACKRFVVLLRPGPNPALLWGRKIRFRFELKNPSNLSGECTDQIGYTYRANLIKTE